MMTIGTTDLSGTIDASSIRQILPSFLQSGQNIGIGKTNPSSTLDVSGTLTVSSIINTNAACFSGYYSTMYNSSSTVITTAASSTYNYLTYSVNSSNTFNWTPSYTSTYKLTIPYNGIYYISYSISLLTGTISLFISKNGGGGNDLNITGQNLACSNTADQTTLSTTVYLTTSDTICVGFYAVSSTTLNATYRNPFSISLIQRTS